MTNRIKALFASEKQIMGFRINDLIGIAIMVIPFLISVNFNHIIPGRRIWFVQLSSDKITNVRPGLVSALCAAVFYAALIIRYAGIFRTKNLFEITVSVIRAFLNCWVIASLISLVVPTSIPDNGSMISVFTKNPESTMLLFGLILSWLGMKTIAGYSWILFILAAWKRLLTVNNTMGMLGAVYILSITFSLLLQVTDVSILKDFANDFRAKTLNNIEHVRGDINAAGNDVSRKVQVAKELVKENVTAYTGIRMAAPQSEEHHTSVKLNLEALDLNKDGIVDDKDFMLLKEKKS